MESASRRPSWNGAVTGGLNQIIAATSAASTPSANEISVTCAPSRIFTPPSVAFLSVNVPRSATTGIRTAGRSSVRPRRAALSRRSAGDVVSGWLCPNAPKPPSAISRRTRMPLAKSPVCEPKSKHAGRYRPNRKRKRLHRVTRLIEHAFDQKDRSDGDEDIFAEECADIVRRGRIGAGQKVCFLVERAAMCIRCRFGHRRDERAHHRRLSVDLNSERDRDVAQEKIAEQKPSRA